VEGIVESVGADRGDLVQEGQVLARLESSVQEAEAAVHRYRSEMQAELKSTQARYEFSLRKLARAEEMAAKETISRHELDEAQTEKNLAELTKMEMQEKKRLAELEYHRARAALELRTIRSPLTGAVVERLISPGDFRNNLDPKMFKLAQIHPLRVVVFVPVSMFGGISAGMRAEVVPEAPLDRPRVAEVTVVDRVVDAASGTFAVRLELPNPKYQLPAGLKCRIRFLPRQAGAQP
jgi:RND family efflux transporter MFP subunit